MISVIVPAKDAANTLGDCLKALLSQEGMQYDRDYEVIVVDDGSTDNTAHLAEEYKVRVIRQSNAGPASARNAGARIARGVLLAFTEGQVKRVSAVVGNEPSSWHEAGEGAEVAIIGHGLFLESLEALKLLREGQGWSVVLVDIEDLYDEFSFGTKTPQAIRDFLIRAKQSWRKVPRFVLLVGDASFDPRNYLGLGGFDFVPTKLVDTYIMETASDDWFVDFNGDGLPEIAVGRVAVQTAEEARAVVSKIVAYEQGLGGHLREVLLVADLQDGFFDFEAASEEVRALIPGSMTVQEVYRGDFDDDVEVHARLLELMNQGPLLVNYLGHGSIEVWRGGLLDTEDAEVLTNGFRLPFFIMMTCLNGYFQAPNADSLAESLLKAGQGGAVAAWASSGLTEPDEQSLLNQAIIRLLFNGESLTLGEAVMRAKAAVPDGDVRRTWVLFGDPATKLNY